jgi:EAL domain-containing protein (putative c-di-GMP-specific phosphodiesterase class I)/GGDEF domain-containing protein
LNRDAGNISIAEDFDTRFRYRAHNLLAAFLIILQLAYIPFQYYVLKNYTGMIFNILGVFWMISVSLFLRFYKRHNLVFYLYLPILCILVYYVFFWHPMSSRLYWLLSLPALIFIIGSDRQGLWASVGFGVLVSILYLCNYLQLIPPPPISFYDYLVFITLFVLIALSGYIYQKRRIATIALLENRIYYHHLSSLGSRNLLEANLSTWRESVLFLININRFERLNNLFGHRFGDRVLKTIAAEIRDFALEQQGGAADIELHTYHLHGDEFALLSPNPLDEFTVLSLVSSLVTRLNGNFNIDGLKFRLNFTVGVSDNKYRKLEEADMALRQAQKLQRKYFYINRSGHNRLEDTYVENMRITTLVEEALEKENIVPYYQPIFDCQTNKVCKAEALARIVLSQEKILNPGQFLPVIRGSELYSRMTQILFLKVLTDSSRHGMPISFNLSYSDIESSAMQEYLFANLEKFPDSKIIFEITESEESQNLAILRDFINELKRKDVQVAIDDFGTGYSNFYNLLGLDFDYLKLDGAMIKSLDTDDRARSIVAGINSLAHDFDFQTIAEFVHSEDIYQQVKNINVDFAQGFFLGEPSPELPEL